MSTNARQTLTSKAKTSYALCVNTTKTILIAGIVALAVSLIGGSVFSGRTAGSSSQLAAVLGSVGGEIRVGYIPYPPTIIKDPNTGDLSGICYELMEEVGKNLGIKINWVEEATYATMIEGIKANRYDVVACVWSNAARAKGADFTTPIYYNAIGAYARKNDTRFASLDKINSKDITITTIDGEMSAFLAKTIFPNAKTLALPQGTDPSVPMLNVRTGKADIAIADVEVAQEFLSKNPNSIKNVSPNNPVAVSPLVYVIPKNQEGFKVMLDTTIEGLINNGTMNALIKKYQKYPGSIYPVAKPYTSPL